VKPQFKLVANIQLSGLLLSGNKTPPTLGAADAFKVNALHIGRRNRKSAEGASGIEGSTDFVQVNLLAVHLPPSL
jgi:hypothetical protein